MYELLIDRLGENGYQQYEISNFSKPGYESQHNLLYWQNEEYYGFGAGAHGYMEGKRVVNASPIKGYIRRVEDNGSAETSSHPVSLKEKVEEELFLGLRTRFGVSKGRFKEKFGMSVAEVYGEVITELKAKGWLTETDQHLILSKEGQFLSNEVLAQFLLPEEVFS